MKIPFKWEILEKNAKQDEWLMGTSRAKVIGGWLVRYDNASTYKLGDDFGYSSNSSMVFVYDPNHEWKIE